MPGTGTSSGHEQDFMFLFGLDQDIQNRKNNLSVREVPFFMSFSMVVLALLCLGLSLLMLPPVREAVLQPVVNALMGNTESFINLLNL